MSNADRQWFCVLGEERKGPFSAMEVKTLVEAGTVTARTMVWNEEMTDWAPLHTTALRSVLGSDAIEPPEVPGGGESGATGSQEDDLLSPWGYYARSMSAYYVNFSARARRAEYWSYVLFYFIFVLLLAAVGAAINEDIAYIPAGLFFLASILPGLSVMVRRLHDIGLSGWFILINLIPYLGGIVMLVFALIPSQQRENKWGPIPPGAE